ncbi:hypothetical protein FA048_16970 [Pedobacter polaris]|uniref:tRNA (Guanine-N1)-methyltransferase n=1 Tax=Pedobacter polaris TaxID=2571273 RepID=A0A4U1CHJ3_9SPHI|nr:hypothetical protein [Pedobacter polaris]TKC05420.1 hypothetical protein FA048_16970 [Pedobacter polaris]
MKRTLFSITTGIILSFLCLNIAAQTPSKTQTLPVKVQPVPAKKVYYQKRAIDTVKNTDFSLNGQYQFMLSRSKSLYGAKLINPARLNSVWKSANDTLRKERIELKNAKAKVSEQEKTIVSLKTEISGKENTLNDTTAKADEISFLGVSFTKGTYNIIVWSIIIILAIALFIVIARSAKNIIEAKHRTQLYDEISAEYQAYKAKSNEQQRKLARELQDERNIIEEMRSRGK